MTFTKIVRPMQLVHNFIRQRGILKILMVHSIILFECCCCCIPLTFHVMVATAELAIDLS
jgi:hypothetical protein